MDKIKDFIKHDLYRAALLFCAIEFTLALTVELSDISGTITLWAMLELFAFSLMTSVGMRLFKIKSLSTPLALLLHYAITFFSAYVIFCIFGQIKNIVGMIVLLTVSYVIIAAVALIVRRITKKSQVKTLTPKKDKKDSYKKQF